MIERQRPRGTPTVTPIQKLRGLVRRHSGAAAVVAGSIGFVIIASFMRGVILARILGPADYGFAIILITIGAGLDLLTDGGVDQYVVRSRFGHRPDVLAAAHAWRLAASLSGAALIALCAVPVATAISAPSLAPAIAAMALPTALRGMANVAIKVQQRERRYNNEAAVEIVRSVAELAALVTAAFILRSHWAVVIGATVNALAQVVASAMLSGGLPRFRFARRPRRLLSRFSLPVIGNAVILFAATQADRLVIASAFNSIALAHYAAACALGQAVSALLSRIISRLFLPIFSASTAGTPAKRRQADRVTLAVLAGSVAVAVGLAIIVPPLVPLIYGPGFSDLHRIVWASAALQMLQIEQAWLTTLMLGAGATARFPLITGVRAASLPLVMPLLWRFQELLLVPFALTVGSAAALALSYQVLVPIGILSFRTAVIAMARSAAAIAVLAFLIF